jgi:hypothetical protein
MSNHKEKLKKQWKDKGYFVINLIRITPVGLPDYLCLKPNHVVFVESKEGRDVLSPLQKIWLKKLMAFGFDCFINDEIYRL